MHFVGIDLAWKAEPPWEKKTGVCIMNTDCEIEDLFLVKSDDDILRTLNDCRHTWVGIDAPLVVPDGEGLRGCERELFNRGIHVLPTSRDFMNRKFGGCRGERLREELMKMGYSLADSDTNPGGMYEVYPYGALNVLTGGEIPRYKKGPAEERRRAALQVLDILNQWVPVETPQLQKEIIGATPGELATTMDKLDALIGVLCVYTHWIYGSRRTELVGDEQDGFILLPRGEVCQ